MKLIKKSITFIVTLALVITAFAGITFGAASSTHISLTASKTEVYVGEEFTVEIDTSEMLINTLTGGFSFNSDVVQFVKYEGALANKSRVWINYDTEDPETGESITGRTEIEAKLGDSENKFGFNKPGTDLTQYRATAPLVTVTLKAIAAGNANILVYESVDGTDAFEGENINPGFTVTVKENALKSIAVTQAPTKTTYHAGEQFNNAGMKVTATYDNGNTEDVTNNCTVDTTTALKATDTSVTISYTKNGVTKETTQAITVSGHTYEETWDWVAGTDGKYTGATLTLNCTVSGCEEVVTPTVDFDSDQTEPTCEDDGQIVYTATAEYEGETYTDTKTVTLPAHGHSYTHEDPTWEWAEDYKSAKAFFACTHTNCTYKKEVTAVVNEEVKKAPTCTEDGSSKYTATAKAGDTYEEKKAEKTVTTTKLGHDYNNAAVRWDWATNLATADAYFHCTRENCNHEEKVSAVVTYETTTTPTCHSKGVETYTATATLGDYTKTATETKELNMTDHVYEITGCEWGDNHSTATIKIKCKFCTENQSLTATVTHPRQEPTCTQAGKITHTATATYAEETYTKTEDETITALGHDYTNVTPSWNWADDYSSATATFACKRESCDHNEVVNATIQSQQTQAPGCETKGTMTYTATANPGAVGGSDKTDVKTAEIPALGHAYDKDHVTWTWTGNSTDGYTKAVAKFACTRNGCNDIEEVEATLSDDETKEATCSETGIQTFTATAKITSGGKEITVTDTKEQTLPKTDHQLEVKSCEWSNDCSSATITIGCKHCSFIVTPNPETTTDLVETVAAKCEVAGKYVYRATATYDETPYTSDKEVPIPALGHDYTSVVPTWEWAKDYSTATAKFVCTRDDCGHEHKVTVNTSSEQITPPSCTEKGEMKYTATAKSGEGYSTYTEYAYADIEALGHDWDEGEVLQEATSTEKGIIEYHCKREGCKETKKEEFAQKSDKIEISTKLEVTEAMKEAGLTNEKKVKAKIEGTLVEKSGFDAKNVLTYEITLMVSFDNGKTYVPATSENIPEEGLLLTIPYPEGTSKKDSFVIAHMFAETTKEHNAGDVEMLDIVKKTGDGIQVVVHSLSPFSVGYKLAEEPTQPVGPKTGDSNNALLWIILAIIAATVIGGGIFLERKYKIFTK